MTVEEILGFYEQGERFNVINGEVIRVEKD